MGFEMSEKRNKYEPGFREEALRVVHETQKPIAQVARSLRIPESTLRNWVQQSRAGNEKDEHPSRVERDEIKLLCTENAKLQIERDVLKRSKVLWAKTAMKSAWHVSSPTRGRTTECRTRSRADSSASAWPRSTSGALAH